MSDQPTGALSGIRVIDLSRILAAPWAAQMLGDLGADVIKVERPRTGDEARQYGPVYISTAEGKRSQESALYVAGNRNKRSITVDISLPEGQAIIRRLAENTDVLLENYKVGTLKRYGLDYESLREINPRIIYCSVTGYGQSGPYAARPGYDAIFQAQGGLMSVTGIPDGEPGAGPMKVGPSIIDVLAGSNASIAVLAALHRRGHTGRGQYIDVALLDSTIASMSSLPSQYLINGFVQPRRGFEGNGGGPSQLVDCLDGKVYISCGNNGHFLSLCELLGEPNLPKDPRFSSVSLRSDNRVVLKKIMHKLLEKWRQVPKHEVLEPLLKRGVPCGAVNHMDEVFKDPQVVHRGVAVKVAHPLCGELSVVANPIRMSENPPSYRRHPPLMGEHTDEILSEELGFSAERIAALKRDNVV